MSEWISVEERLPANGQRVLMWHLNKKEKRRSGFRLGVYHGKIKIGAEDCPNWSVFGQTQSPNPTHWMPLPEAPEMSPDPIDIYGKSVLLTDPPKEWPPENPEGAVFIPLGIGYWAYPARGLPPSPTPPPTEEAPK